MYRNKRPKTGTVKVNTSYVGETIEQKVRRVTTQKEPIKDGAPIIYTDRKDGVQPAYDIRTDRFELAVDAQDYIAKSHLAKREMSLAERAKANQEIESKSETTKASDGGAMPTGATGNNPE